MKKSRKLAWVVLGVVVVVLALLVALRGQALWMELAYGDPLPGFTRATRYEALRLVMDFAPVMGTVMGMDYPSVDGAQCWEVQRKRWRWVPGKEEVWRRVSQEEAEKLTMNLPPMPFSWDTRP